MTDLGTVPGYTQGGVFAVNAAGSAVGQQNDHDPGTGAGVFHAFAWTPDAPNGTTGRVTDLAAGYRSEAAAVNDAGQVVGAASYLIEEPCDPDYPGYPNCGGFREEARAILWENGVAIDLTGRLIGAPGVTLTGATAINASGLILATDASGRSYLLTSATVRPSLTVGDVTIVEGNTGTRAATFTVTLSAASTQPVTVAYATADGTATAGSDYRATSGTLTFAPGQTSQTITVLVNGDRAGEANETFFVNLASPTNATIAGGRGVGAIADDEPRVSIGDVTRAEGKKGQTTSVTFTVTLSAAYDQAVTMSFRTTNGTATTGDGDFIARTGTLTFVPGETTRTITVEVKGDSKREADEYFYLDLFGNSGNSLFTKSRGCGTILNDD
jgi:hypothetical protein